MKFRVQYLGNTVLVEAGQECRTRGAKTVRAAVTSGQYPAAQKLGSGWSFPMAAG